MTYYTVNIQNYGCCPALVVFCLNIIFLHCKSLVSCSLLLFLSWSISVSPIMMPSFHLKLFIQILKILNPPSKYRKGKKNLPAQRFMTAPPITSTIVEITLAALHGICHPFLLIYQLSQVGETMNANSLISLRPRARPDMVRGDNVHLFLAHKGRGEPG